MGSLPQLLSEDEARHNLQVFTKSAMISKARSYIRSSQPLSVVIEVPTNNDIVAPGAEVVNGPDDTASSQLEFYRNPKYHTDVLATFIATAMSIAKYVPLLTELTDQANKQSEDFAKFLQILVSTFPQYVKFAGASSIAIENKSSYNQLLSTVHDFIQETAIDPSKAGAGVIQMIKNATHAMDSTVEGSYRRSLYTSYSFQGRARNPQTTMYWSSVNLERNRSGKTTCVSAELKIVRFTVEVISNSVIADAHILAEAKGRAAQEIADIINGHINPSKDNH
ncbi:hypothetical protein SELMODRAFT_447839 [Selaginella moellendorffii]|uniref:Uncharacterized protein n=1 Tax=Selaginella moellendorffii TaxID=88036 RepID=D8T2M9_SELML|nr:uncharacterized protein LOC9629329 [Selaginella moellendorffii]XP_002989813.1 uncharacterized protein LOC9629331 [Selaginella moellendorffii]XP_002989814.1 uncharacterized protein LOC9629334 [Selaginella moellendorffii]XP_024519329.1 uncharacterized protein LOC9629334 [Selaginella moellendorffii]XP_024519330.1 uncharacterized protein LOC9629334 [Selaginella moellendorffii]XP_024519342.1 uncharacterized protein LOC9629331 [Selaginella moellendorffii]XP_024519344.1 uncharacterized protein LO|eukprot:XP_002989812.1 uncharacterized protein LOC9629329 [Selaginella moellendorffii]